ncbi:transglutaminase domain-containing protein [uncultured Algibacter sp.]|uniref:transglutaminase domain-containing protein n=1 Tax=uncultured Algibacter sp. TaxID=298659 RepID=UPI003216DE3A
MAKSKRYFLNSVTSIYMVCLLCLSLNAQSSDFKHINFKKADSIASTHYNSRLTNLPLLAFKLTKDLDTKVEKFRAIHTWVCQNIESDYAFAEKTIRKRKKYKNNQDAFSVWNARVKASVFKRLLNDKKTICSGYAYLLKHLSTLADIECEIVNGYSKTVNTNIGKIDIPNHSWNAVRLNNSWYLVDATLASGIFLVENHIFLKNYNNGYFLADPELFSKSHYPLDHKWLLLDNNLTLTDFVDAPLIYSSSYKHNVWPVSPKRLETKVSTEKDIIFSFKTLDGIEINDFQLVINKGFKLEKVKPNIIDEAGYIMFKYRFSKKGNYDVHLKIKDDIVASFTVHVAKKSVLKSNLI